MDYYNFLQELDADREMRSTVNLYKDPKKKKKADTDIDEEEVHLDELLDCLDIEENKCGDQDHDEGSTTMLNFFQGLAESSKSDEDDL